MGKAFLPALSGDTTKAIRQVAWLAAIASSALQQRGRPDNDFNSGRLLLTLVALRLYHYQLSELIEAAE